MARIETRLTHRLPVPVRAVKGAPALPILDLTKEHFVRIPQAGNRRLSDSDGNSPNLSR